MARPGSCAWGLLGLQLGLLAAAAPLPLRRDSLSVNITITPKTQPWCEAEVQVYGERCFSYDCQSHAVTAVCVQGMKVEAALREDLRGNLKDLAEKFNEKLLDIEPEDSRGSGPLSLQASMVIQEEASGRSRGSWQLVISGRISLRLDLVTGHWTAERPGDRWMLETWKEDRDMNATLWRMSRGDWRTWLQEVAAHWETPGTTASLFSSRLVCIWKVFRPPQHQLLRGVSVTLLPPLLLCPCRRDCTTEHHPRQVCNHECHAGTLVRLWDHPRLHHPAWHHRRYNMEDIL
ncbi:UL16-binding protein 1-like isoform X2 [Talpa occidentalis]|uniref:UL16-binding protein 1-like isoform X2 n=1 Tax=Talpa occidentalis TaxID=50954 RepID=UPI0023F8250A|nr:UL16-binding protein 1-like isoform X2 [Talpa occidentalis]